MFEYIIEITYTVSDERDSPVRLTDDLPVVFDKEREFTEIWNVVNAYHQADSITVLDVCLPEETREELRARGYDL